MNIEPETRRAIVGTVGITAVTSTVALSGHNGWIVTTSIIAIVALTDPDSLERLPFTNGPR